MTLDLFQPIAETQKERVNNAMKEIAPHDPGVYTMYNARDEVLYIGKAKDLYKRVTSYRYSKSKKVQSLVAQVARIGYEVCKTETDAVLLENLLIRSLRPPYNHANKKTETYYYISSGRKGYKREFRLSMRVLDDYSNVYGCFKGHGRVRKGLGALLRFLYLADTKIKSPYYLPAQLLNRLTPIRFSVAMKEGQWMLVHQLLSGSSGLLIHDFERLAESMDFTDKFSRSYFMNELEQLKIFFALGPERNHQLKKELNLDSDLIRQEHLDDLYAVSSSGVFTERI